MIMRLRSLALIIVGLVRATLTATLLLLMFWTPASWRRFVLVAFCRFALWAGDVICGMKVVIEGQEPHSGYAKRHHAQTLLDTGNLRTRTDVSVECVGREARVVMSTIVGWAIGLVLNPIAIDRGKGRSAVKQVIEQGKQRLADGIWVSIFPEGTRVPPGQTRKYGISGAALAQAAGVAIVPVAHNAGDCWRPRGFSMRPGLVRFCIGPSIDASTQSPQENDAKMALDRRWIDGKVNEIGNGGWR